MYQWVRLADSYASCLQGASLCTLTHTVHCVLYFVYMYVAYLLGCVCTSVYM